VGLWLVAALAAEPHDPLTSTGKPRWLVTCSCGWTREASSEWAANSISKLHPRLGSKGIEHVTRVEAPDESAGPQQLTLT
jgi:hypothetical protein